MNCFVDIWGLDKAATKHRLLGVLNKGPSADLALLHRLRDRLVVHNIQVQLSFLLLDYLFKSNGGLLAEST